MNPKRLALLATITAGPCRTATPNLVDSAGPVAPAIQFNETVPPRGLTLLILDGRSGAPIPGTVIYLGLVAQPEQSDAFGVLRLRNLPVGRSQVQVRRINYFPWRQTVRIPDSAGVALVAQLRYAGPTQRMIVGAPH